MRVPTQTHRTLADQHVSVNRPQADLTTLDIEWVATDELYPNEWNPNSIDARTFEIITRSIKEHGFTQPILVNPHNRIIDGYHRWKIAKSLDLASVPCVRVDIPEAEQRIATIRMNTRGTMQADALAQLHAEIARMLPTPDDLQSALMLDSDTMDEIKSGLDLPSIDTLNLPVYEKGDLPKSNRAGKRIIGYYGGKDNLACTIIAQMPEHTCYVEPFAGSAAVLFAKEPSAHEVLNDTKRSMVALYRTFKSDHARLKKCIEHAPTARVIFDDCRRVLANADEESEFELAFAAWYVRVHSHLYMGHSKATFAIVKTAGRRADIRNAYRHTLDIMQGRLDKATIESRDALHCITTYDAPGTFYYIDPPYYASDMADYGGYTEHDYCDLLDTLANIEGKFILSSYDNEPLCRAIDQHRWHGIGVVCRKTSSAKDVGMQASNSIELLVANYPIPVPAGGGIDEVARE